jgi:hypothetical protein
MLWPGLDSAIHDCKFSCAAPVVDARVKPAHDDGDSPRNGAGSP